jgi:UDP-N-acetylglucosamine--N-acetylmuramyl-(pentapeptide) pyrophosphoryl-undecaprenol N-acetylglucosamine transferase
VSFAGSPDRVEARLVPEAGFEFDSFRISGLPRRPGPAQLRALLQAARAPAACRRIIEARRPDVVLGGGGFVAGPMVYAAWRKRVPAGLTEADAYLGLANRLALPFARRIFLSYPIAHGSKYRVTGRPIPASSQPLPRNEARRLLELPPDGPVLGVFGSLAGARALNEFALETFGAGGPAVLHVAGQRDFASLRNRATRPDYRLLPTVRRFGAALGAVDVALSRSGGTVWELAAAGLPAVLVPYPHATADHQTKNGRYFERAGGAIVVPETELHRAAQLVHALLANPGRRHSMSEAMRRVARPEAAGEIAEELIALAAA